MFYFLYGEPFPLPYVCGSLPWDSRFSAPQLPEAAQNGLVLMLHPFHRALQDLVGYMCTIRACVCHGNLEKGYVNPSSLPVPTISISMLRENLAQRNNGERKILVHSL